MPTAPATFRPSRPRAPRHEISIPQANRQATRALNTGSRQWRAQRRRVLERDHYTCASCGKFGDQVDHIHNNASEHVDDDQLQTLCIHHHSQKTARELNASRKR